MTRIHSISSRQQLLAWFRAGVAAADPGIAVTKALSWRDGGLHIALDMHDPSRQRAGDWRQIQVLAFGKAACAMAAAAAEIVPADRLAGGLVVTTYQNYRPVAGFDVIAAGHPLPDHAGLLAARLMSRRAAAAGRGELLLVLVSGGGSALLPAPVDGIGIDEKIATTELLLASGAGINAINCVRKHLSTLKGGGLARLAVPADLHALILSDVLGDDLSAIASGPTVPDASSFADAVAVLERAGISAEVPAAVGDYLAAGVRRRRPETPKPGDAVFKRAGHTLVGSNCISLDAVLAAATAAGCQTRIYSRELCGEARLVAEALAGYARRLQRAGLDAPTAIIAGGETTVTLSGNGKGGRNQELALAFALAAESVGLADWTLLSGGTDGRDGPTDAAGGIVDTGTLARIRDAGLDPAAMLAGHDSHPALAAAGDLLATGATGTNVADLQILLLQPAAA